MRQGIVAAVAALAAGCTAPPTGPADYRDASPVRIRAETARFTLSFAARDAEQAVRDSEGFSAFLEDYLRRGRSPLRVTMRRVDDPFAERARRQMVTAILLREGIPIDKVVVESDGQGGLGVNDFRFSFRRYAVKVSECGDWSGQAGYNPTGLPHTNYGCSYQRNIGLMLADPGDLADPRETGPIDTPRTDRVIKTYRDATTAGSPKPRNEYTDFSTVK